MCVDFRCGTGRAELNTDRVKRLHGSWFRLHGACSSGFFGVARGVRFPSSEVGNPNFSQYSELVMIWNLIDFDGEAMRILIGLN